MENWEIEFDKNWEDTRNGTQVDYQDIKEFISSQIQKAKMQGVDEVLSLIEKGDLPLVRRLIAEAEKRGVAKAETADKILWEQMKEWNNEWRAENPKERKLIRQDALKLIQWKITQAHKEKYDKGFNEGYDKALGSNR